MLELDPSRLAISVEVGIVYNYARQFDEAIAVCKKLANENPTYAQAHDCLADAYRGKKMYSQAIEEYKMVAQLSHDEFASALVQGYGSGGWNGALARGLEFIQTQRKTQPSSAYGTAYFIAGALCRIGRQRTGFFSGLTLHIRNTICFSLV